MKMKMLCGAVAMGALAGCDPSSVTQSMHPDYVRHEMTSQDGESDYAFLCAPQASEAATKAQLAKARQMTDAHLEASAESMFEQMMSDDDFTTWDAYKVTRDSQKQADVFVKALKAETGCVLVEAE
ncbi:hypothetical protein [Celeribacter naphthalenivorans]|uniref:hypothetical protein n=1 Tax=Celeribacter naphthalenivorans TaxID=1614694 RepID=UPI001CFAB93C|nr:hypothetical protein [Celeribacter naphthalenivorans]